MDSERRGRATNPYMVFAQAELDAAHSTEDKLDQRTAFVVTTSGGVVSLLFGFIAVLTQRTGGFAFNSGTRYALYIALGCFAGASVMAIAATFAAVATGRLSSIDRSIEDLRSDHDQWEKFVKVDQEEVEELAIRTLTAVLRRVQRRNHRRNRLVAAGLAAEMLGVVSLAVAVAIVVATA